MQDELTRSENRASKLDLQRIALEGDIQRLQMVLQEKENHLRNCQERLESQSKTSAQLEERLINSKFVLFGKNNYILLQVHCFENFR